MSSTPAQAPARGPRTEFDQQVNALRKAVPWASLSFSRFCEDLARSGKTTTAPILNLEVRPAPQNESGLWYALTFVCTSGEVKRVGASRFDTLLWRAAFVELLIRQRAERPRKPGMPETTEETTA
jgi:hypothetical protein